ncbi:MAG: hypothetical protein GXO24_00405 [Chlorobi bacterium]|nr:hypothetical protein [Chlorobiota bacterium]
MWAYLHGLWAFFVLIILIMATGYHAAGLLKGRRYDMRTDFRLALFALVVTAIQLVLGVGAYLSSDYFRGIREGHMGEYMKNAHARLITVEHPTMAVLAFLLMLYGFRRMFYGIDPRRKFFSVLLFYGMALLLILSRLPWSDWL